MDDKVQKHMDEAMDQIRALFMKAVTRIEAIKPGEKIPATQLADDLAKERGMTGPQLYPTLKFILTHYPGVEIRRGAHGGIFRPLPDAEKKESEATVTSDEGPAELSKLLDLG